MAPGVGERQHMNQPGAAKLGYSYYVVIALMCVYTLSFMDRVLISLLVEPIRTELSLSDTEIGMLIGFGFVLFYSVMGLPFGSLADRSNRRNLIFFGIIGWSLATAGSGVVQGFGGLLLMRTLVGIGEATLSPAAMSTIADRFPVAKLGFATSIYSSGVVIGGGLAMVFGGMMAQWSLGTSLTIPLLGTYSGWRMTFLLIGLLGLPIAAILLLTVREAKRRNAAAPQPFAAIVTLMAEHRRAFAGTLIGLSSVVMANYAALLWGPAYFSRAHGLSMSEIGLILGVMNGALGLVGVLAGGMIADRFSRLGTIDAPIKVVIYSQLAQLPFLIVAFTTGNTTLAIACTAISVLFTSMIGGLQGTTIALLVAPQMRGRMMAIYLLVANLIGMGLGPLLVGILSDLFGGMIGYAIAITATCGILCGLLLLGWSRPAIRQAITAQMASAA